ncbi:substrate-binding domain-containing protein [Rhodoblastus acidophilus]|uniref:Substrate-binding domain-containing protein n=1 Tax=Candidatus Rhodoblastus alkanivorans TaxID=2954117 RepID=A0ABS9Z8K8_9HYPH|nr:substrate-binding domain-containing protein [Candidatus Rhodoblastus alkanivorans]MCI4680702.1 substrate-binding domain-containing protein [Candidatus Rhodoblastus alkanivorans]MCI4684028.1 substrate-binding domain-containing protein [Candidatus Rhodoblastus alkanivorans]MDI4641347.1 substrate-binding domain-containing protein [Rhodoblastus acidophilus]
MKFLSRAAFFAAAALLVAGASAGARAENVKLRPDFAPPWQGGANNDVAPAQRGLDFTEPDADNLADFHGSPQDPKLTLYFGGNYFFATAELVDTFEKQHPEFKGRIYWETIPPGLLAQQIKAGGTITVGNMTWTAQADVYFAGLRRIKQSIDEGIVEAPAVPYVTNTLTIMVPKGNPAHVTSLSDLGKPSIKLVMPNPAYEGIGRQIKAALGKAGGEALVKAVYETKVADGSTILTHIHHRQTPLYLMQGRAQAGVTWQSEAIFQEKAGHPIENVDIPDAHNATAIYAGAVVKGAPHPDAAKLWLEFIKSPASLAIFEKYGFKPYKGGAN